MSTLTDAIDEHDDALATQRVTATRLASLRAELEEVEAALGAAERHFVATLGRQALGEVSAEAVVTAREARDRHSEHAQGIHAALATLSARATEDDHRVTATGAACVAAMAHVARKLADGCAERARGLARDLAQEIRAAARYEMAARGNEHGPLTGAQLQRFLGITEEMNAVRGVRAEISLELHRRDAITPTELAALITPPKAKRSATTTTSKGDAA